MIVSIIAALAKNNVIGSKNGIPWYISADLKRFAKLTKGHYVIVGRKTFDSIVSRNGAPLRERVSVIITRKGISKDYQDCIVVKSIEEAIKVSQGGEVFVIGGGEIYRLAMPHAKRLYLTDIEANIEGDVFFPKFNVKDWNLVSMDEYLKDDVNPYNYKFLIYEKKK